MGLENVFLSVRPIVESLARSTMLSSTTFCSNNRKVQRARPFGGLEQAKAISLATAHRAVTDQLGQLIAGFNAAGPAFSVIVDAHLVQLRRIDAVEPIHHIGKLKSSSILDDRADGEAFPRREKP